MDENKIQVKSAIIFVIFTLIVGGACGYISCYQDRYNKGYLDGAEYMEDLMFGAFDEALDGFKNEHIHSNSVDFDGNGYYVIVNTKWDTINYIPYVKINSVEYRDEGYGYSVNYTCPDNTTITGFVKDLEDIQKTVFLWCDQMEEDCLDVEHPNLIYSYALPQEAIELKFCASNIIWGDSWHNIQTDANNILYIDGIKTNYSYYGNLSGCWIRFGDDGFYVNGDKR